MLNKKEIRDSLAAGTINDETLRVIVEAHLEKNSMYNKIQLIHLNEKELNDTIDSICKNHSAEKPSLYQIIVTVESHSFTLDLKITDNNSEKHVSMIILDAAGDMRSMRVCDLTKCRDDITIINVCGGGQIEEGIQKGEKGCAAFALDHALQVQIIDLHAYIEKLPETCCWQENNPRIQAVNWQDMPPEIYRNVQSNSQWEEYKKYKVKNGSPVNNEYDCYREEHQTASNDSKHPGNIMPSVKLSLTSDAMDFLSTLEDAKFIEIFNDSIYNEDNMSKSDFNGGAL